ncbi:MAG TPA: VWA domain-containing protein [Bryobacteraceae bacterium]|jgi:VWFA-related protein|nr:VWA domain-containing protein [Bryobacteraceae bacterium]
MSRTLLLSTVLCGSLIFPLLAQQPPARPTPPPDLEQTNDLTNFRVTLQQVLAPVLVYDRKHNYVNGLTSDQFRLYDNDKEQNLTSVDVTYTPISMVVAVQANSEADKILPQVNRIGAMLKPIILGDQGEAAVIAYDHRVRLLQPFTSDADDITKAIKGIHAGSTSSRLIDAVEQSVFLLAHRDKTRRRILLVIGEGRDAGSEAHARETLEKLQLANVAVYWVDMSHIIGKLTAPPPDPRPTAMPPAAAGNLGGGHPSTPTTYDQTFGTDGYSADAIPLMMEIYHDVKNIFKVSTATLFTKGTGGEQFPFATSHGLEQAISAIGDELHSQYLITYTPNNTGEGGFHKIQVEVIGRQYKCETKPGYFMSPIFH